MRWKTAKPGFEKRVILGASGHVSVVGNDWVELPDIYTDECNKLGLISENDEKPSVSAKPKAKTDTS